MNRPFHSDDDDNLSYSSKQDKEERELEANQTIPERNRAM
jgi:hypothetical protein